MVHFFYKRNMRTPLKFKSLAKNILSAQNEKKEPNGKYRCKINKKKN